MRVFIEGAINDCAVANIVWSTIYAYDASVYPDNPPTQMADFFDLEAYPGKRGMTTDVCVPIFMNDLVSGFVAGRSSALYSLVMNEVLRRVLGKRPVPILVPNNDSPIGSGAPQVDSLLHDYLTGI